MVPVSERVSLRELNARDVAGFVAAMEDVWERSPWVAEAASAKRPFANAEALAAAMWRVVREAGEARQLALLRAHPDLADRLARAGALTAESATEQASLGLDRLDGEEYAFFTESNRAYRERFGFPFIICVREQTKDSIRAAFARRLAGSREEELQIALDEVRRIAEYRLKDRLMP
jgi:2-oxo-4-hydroxy-4-carboxy-5-ureidoimidazoline decarboxylase